MTATRLRTIALQRGGLLALTTLVLYILLAPHHVVDGDNAEFSTLSVLGGSAHPSGYPLYVLWLRATSWLPGASPAHTAAIATGILGAASVLVLHAACRAWGARPLAATIATAVFATGPVVLRVVTEAEVFALNNLVVATVLWLSATQGPLRGVRRAGALGLVAGLGLANNLTCALVAPVGLLGVVRTVREVADGGRSRSGAAAIGTALAIAGLAVGLTPYLYLLLAPDTPMSWGVVRDLERLLAVILREDYGGPGSFHPSGGEVSMWWNFTALGKTIGRGWLVVLAIAGVAALGVRAVRPRASVESRIGWAMLAVSFLVAGPLLVARFNVPPEGLGLYVNQRFHLLPLLLLAIPVAHAVDRLPLRRLDLTNALVSSIGVIVLAAASLGYVGRVHSPAVETSARNLLHSLPPDAVVIHGQDELHFVPGYVQWALGERRDVAMVMWSLMGLSWYRERLAARGVLSGPGTGSPKGRLVANLLARGRPVFVDRLQRDILEAFPTYPYGIVRRVVGPQDRMPSVREVFALNEQLYAAFALDYPRPGPDDEYATEVHERYRIVWTVIAKALEQEGAVLESARAIEHAQRLAPAR